MRVGPVAEIGIKLDPAGPGLSGMVAEIQNMAVATWVSTVSSTNLAQTEGFQ